MALEMEYSVIKLANLQMYHVSVILMSCFGLDVSEFEYLS